MCLLWVKILFLFLDEYKNLKPFFESKKSPENWTGDLCETDVDECVNDPCRKRFEK